MINRIVGTPDMDLLSHDFPEGTLRILQITDTHLYADADQRLLGVNTFDSFQLVLEAFRDTGWPVDLVLATGDLVHDASPRGYHQMAELLDIFKVPVYCLPGNHDLSPIMREHLRSDYVATPQVVDHGSWRLVLLDSVIPNEVGGHLADAEIDMLADALTHCTKHTLICLHHQPIPVGSRWIDEMGLDNPDGMFNLIEKADQVKGILWGHVHQTYDGTHNGLRMMASPSTCVQFAPNQDDFGVDEEPPGFRLIALQPDGNIHSQVIRAADMPNGLDVASIGY